MAMPSVTLRALKLHRLSDSRAIPLRPLIPGLETQVRLSDARTSAAYSVRPLPKCVPDLAQTVIRERKMVRAWLVGELAQ
jgi:hypothetical protein